MTNHMRLSDNPASDGASRHTVVKLSELPAAIEAAAMEFMWTTGSGYLMWQNLSEENKGHMLRKAKQILLAAEKAEGKQ